MACVGRVKFFLPDKGWGRLEVTGPLPVGLSAADCANGVFVHYKDIIMQDEKTLASLEEGQDVSFAVLKGEKGWQASEVRGVDGNPVRTRLHRNMLAGIFRGVVTHWNTEKAFGWIATDLSPQSLGMQRVPKSVLALNDGRVYFRWRDCGQVREGQEMNVQKGKAVVFQLYWDEKGLGALQVCDAITLRPLSSHAGGPDHYKQLLAIQQLPGSEQLAELAKEMDKCYASLVVLRSQAGSIIGQKGETVKDIKAKSGVDRIYVENGLSDYRLVELKGSPPAVAAATLLIAEHMVKEPGLEATPESSMEVRVVVPDDGFGRVVGKGKAQLTAIEQRCAGATLQIAPKVTVGSGLVQAVVVAGKAEAMAEAVKLLLSRIVTCCSASPLSRAGVAGLPCGQGSMGAMFMFQHLASLQQGAQHFGLSTKGYGNKGSGWSGNATKGAGKGKGAPPMGASLPAARSINL